MPGGRVLATVAGVLAAVTLGACGGAGGDRGSGNAKDIAFYIFNEPGGGFEAGIDNCNKKANGRYKVRYVKLPTDSDQQRELIARRLAAKDADLDVIGMDVNWTAEFAEAEWILPWEGPNQQEAERGIIPALLQAAKYEGKTWVAPFTTNTQLLWYHKDVVKTPPKTWDEMIEMAKEIGPEKGKIVVQGRRYEGLVVWVNSLIASAGGEIVDRQGNVKLGPPAVKAAQIVKRVASEAGTTSVSNEKEDTGKDTFAAGGLAFMINYPFVYAEAAKDPKELKNFGYARYPAVNEGEPSRVTYGGINLGVSRYAKDPELAFEAAKCLRSDENMILASEKGGLAPTREALYENPKIKKAFPFADIMQETLRDGVPRPVLPTYSDVSLAVQDAFHPPTKIEPESAVEKLRDNLQKAKNGELF